jgi:hypothetical protein
MSALLIAERRIEDVTVLELRGRITVGDGDAVLGADVQRCLKRATGMVPDMTELLCVANRLW